LFENETGVQFFELPYSACIVLNHVRFWLSPCCIECGAV